ncbi:MAG TPA: ABC transporter ATP-binding protein [Longimicrobiales bacterium]|nr:ABC transporter ATP-binding protein [Longimicrobiales bacterium]
MIRFENVVKQYRIAPGPGRKAGVVEALREVSAVVEPGEVVGVVGPNGAGKTTLFGLVLGFLEATAGVVRIDNAEPRAFVRANGASYLPERFQLPRDWTIQHALRALLKLDGAKQDVVELLQEYDLTSYANAAAHTLSRGTMQRVGIAQALATPRRLVVLDEPTEGLDPVWRIRFRESVMRLRSPERVVFIASHDLTEVERVADRVVIMNQGRITDSLDLRSQSREPRDYILTLANEHEAVASLFNTARVMGNAVYAVTVESAGDLSTRIAALLEAGATLVSVTPGTSLEQRITQAPSQ